MTPLAISVLDDREERPVRLGALAEQADDSGYGTRAGSYHGQLKARRARLERRRARCVLAEGREPPDFGNRFRGWAT